MGQAPQPAAGHTGQPAGEGFMDGNETQADNMMVAVSGSHW